MEVTARIATLGLAETFVISRESQDTAEVVQVEIRHDGVSGFGEGAPIERYDESAESALQYIEEVGDALGDDPFALDEIESRLEPREWAARSALDAALYDLQGRLTGVPVWRLLGLGVMLGCMIESGLGIAAAAQVAGLCDHVDLDGNLLLAHDPWPGVELRDGIQVPADEPGLGVREEVPDPR